MPNPADAHKDSFEREYRLRLTVAGRQAYVRRWADHKAAYPDVDAPDPFHHR